MFWIGASAGISGDPPDLTYRTGTSEVRLTFSATDQNDHGVATLQPHDFAIVDTGFIVRDFQSFTRSDYTRLEIAILIDSSESMKPSFRKEIADTLELLSQTSGVPDENISLLTFLNGKPALLCSSNCRVTNAAEKLPDTHAAGLTPLFDSIVFASELTAQHDAQAQRVLIVFSDGQDTISRYSFVEARDASIAHNLQIYSIDLGRSDRDAPGAQVLRALAASTGGRFFPASERPERALELILQGFRASYVVSYRLPTRSSGFHTVQILPTHNLHLTFRSRSGYYYPNYVR